MQAQNAFITTWKTTASNESITIPTSNGTYNYNVDWGDGTINNGLTGPATHSYSNPGIHTVKLTGTFTRINFSNSNSDNANDAKIQTIEQWGDIVWKDYMYGAFKGCVNLQVTATDAPDLSQVFDMSHMFAGATYFNQDISHWDVSNVKYMFHTFNGASSFNQNLGDWDISRVVPTASGMGGIFANTALSTENYDATLIGWATLSPGETNIPTGVAFGAGNTTYCQSQNARQKLINDFGWTIYDGGTDCSDAFITTWKTTAANQSITIPTTGSGYNYTVNWGDGTTSTNQTGNATHTYAAPGIHTIKITGDFPQIYFNDQGDRYKIQSIEQWGTQRWRSMKNAFKSCGQLTYGNVPDVPDLSQVTDLSSMFERAYDFNGAIGDWDVSHVTNMREMFKNAQAFNQDIGAWDVSGVTTMYKMFYRALVFNQDIGAWNVSNVTNMNSMFLSADEFDQDLSSWNLSKVTSMAFMFRYASLSTENYDATLSGWAVDNSGNLNDGMDDIPANISFHGGYSTFCQAEVARQDLISNHGWSITDGGKSCGYVFENDSWVLPNGNPSGISSVNDNITVVDGEASLTADTEVGNLTINSGATLKIEKVLNLNKNLYNNGSLIFISNENNTGQLAAVPAGSQIVNTGSITVQRFIPAGNQAADSESHLGRAYRFLSSAVNSAGSIHDNWQEGATSYTDNPKPGYGTHITGLNTIPGNIPNEHDLTKDQQNGFDYTPSGNPSLYTYDNGSQQWNPIGNTNSNTLQVGVPYQLMVRGDRSIDVTDNTATSTNTVLQATGDLIIGDYTFSDLGQNSGDFNFFGNPYQAAVDMTQVVSNSTNINPNSYIVYDPTLNTRGAFVSVELASNPGDNALGSEANQFLQVGQAAFVTTNNLGTTPELLFKESFKATAQPQTNTFRVSNYKYINVQLIHNNRVIDGVRIYFDQDGSNQVLPNDTPKYGNLDENIAVVNNGNYLSIEHRSLPVEAEVLPLFINQYRQENYSLKVKIPAQVGEVTAYLEDAYLNTHNELAAGETTFVNFEIDQNIAESVDANRFSISFETDGLDTNSEVQQSFNLWPNPTQGSFSITLPGQIKNEEVTISIYTILGQEIYQSKRKASTNKIFFNDLGLNSGIYIVKMLAEEGKEMVKKLIVR